MCGKMAGDGERPQGRAKIQTMRGKARQKGRTHLGRFGLPYCGARLCHPRVVRLRLIVDEHESSSDQAVERVIVQFGRWFAPALARPVGLHKGTNGCIRWVIESHVSDPARQVRRLHGLAGDFGDVEGCIGLRRVSGQSRGFRGQARRRHLQPLYERKISFIQGSCVYAGRPRRTNFRSPGSGLPGALPRRHSRRTSWHDTDHSADVPDASADVRDASAGGVSRRGP